MKIIKASTIEEAVRIYEQQEQQEQAQNKETEAGT